MVSFARWLRGFAETVGVFVTAAVLTVLTLCWVTGTRPFEINLRPIFLPYVPQIEVPPDAVAEREV